jgi:hypothetical protein
MDKTILLASFIFPERVEWFLEYLEAKFNITKNKVFCYKNLDDESKVIITFKLIIPEGKRMNLKDLFPSAIPIHKKGSALYTINALNKLIDQTMGTSAGNTDYKSFKINWDEYQNKIILINGKELGIFNIERVF